MTDAPEYLTVPELADLLRIKERKVYDLAASGAVPCTRATGKLLFPEAEVRTWIARQGTSARTARPAVFLGSHDPLLEWALRQSQCGLATYFDGSADGLARFAAGDGMATGLHIEDRDGDGWNVAAVKERCGNSDAVLIRWASRKRGFVTKQGLFGPSIGWSDLGGLRIATRQKASGTSGLFDRLVQAEGLSFEPVGPFHSEQDAVLAVAEGEADLAFGLEVVARQFGLAFTGVVEERFDLLVDRAAYFEAPFQSFLAFCRSGAFGARAGSLAGYDTDGLGEVVWNAP